MTLAGLSTGFSAGTYSSPDILAISAFSAQSNRSDNPDNNCHRPLANTELSPEKITLSAERELRYLLHINQLREFLSSGSVADYELRYSRIIQHQFNTEERQYLSGALPANISKIMFGAIEAKSARIRETISNDKMSYELQTKSARSPEFRLERTEAEMEISKEFFERLSLLATKGSMDKQRIAISGEITLQKGKKAPIELHIDHIQSAGIRQTNAKIPATPAFTRSFVIAELEFFDRSVLPYIERGNHSFSHLLKKALLISGDPFLSKAFSSSKIAKHGFLPESFEVMKRYLKQVK